MNTPERIFAGLVGVAIALLCYGLVWLASALIVLATH